MAESLIDLRVHSLDDLCMAIDCFCKSEFSPVVEGFDSEILQQHAQKLLELSKRLAQRKQRMSQSENEVENTNKTGRALWADAPLKNDSLCIQLLSVIVIVLITLPYYVCVGYRDWFIDEGFAITRNPDAQGKTPVLEVLKHDFWGTSLNPPEGYNTHKSYRPLLTLLYSVEWQLAAKTGWAGRENQPMRLLSCMIHSLNSVLVLWLTQTLQIRTRWAVLGAALFAAHPLHIENIVYLVGRADMLATTLAVWMVLLFLRQNLGPNTNLTLRLYIAMAFLTATAGLFKEPGFTYLFFVACAEVVLRRRWRHVIAILICFATIGFLRCWYVGGTKADFGYVDTPIRYYDSKLSRTLSYLLQHAFYAKILILPWNQSWDYSFDALPMVADFTDVRILFILAAYLSVASLGAYGLRHASRNPAPVLGLGLIIIPFIPASNLFFLVGTTIGERLMYPCTVGWSVLLVAIASQTRCLGLPARVCRAGACILLLAAYVWNSNVRMGHWSAKDRLFAEDAKYWYRSSKVLHQQAVEMQQKGELHGALDFFNRSLQVFDDQALTDYCIARILMQFDRFPEAFQRFEKILNGHGIGLHDGNDFLWMTDLGYTLVKLGEYVQGEHYLKEGLDRMPHSCYAWNALGVAQAQRQDLTKAVETLMVALECDRGSAITWSNLAVVYAYGQAGDRASEALQEAARLNSTDATVVWNWRVLNNEAPAGTQPVLQLFLPDSQR